MAKQKQKEGEEAEAAAVAESPAPATAPAAAPKSSVPPWATHESDQVAQLCRVSMTDRLRPSRERRSLKDGRGETWWFSRSKQPSNQLRLTPPQQRDLRARGWDVAPVKE